METTKVKQLAYQVAYSDVWYRFEYSTEEELEQWQTDNWERFTRYFHLDTFEGR